MSTDDYTPTTEEVEHDYAVCAGPASETVRRRTAEFDRWLAGVEQEAAAKALEALAADPLEPRPIYVLRLAAEYREGTRG